MTKHADQWVVAHLDPAERRRDRGRRSFATGFGLRRRPSFAATCNAQEERLLSEVFQRHPEATNPDGASRARDSVVPVEANGVVTRTNKRR